MKKVYILHTDDLENIPTIFAVFSTRELADKAAEFLRVDYMCVEEYTIDYFIWKENLNDSTQGEQN